MIAAKVAYDSIKFDKAIRVLGPNVVKGVLKITINESLRKGRTEVRRAIQQVYNISTKRIMDSSPKKGISLKYATDYNMTGQINAGHSVISFASLTGVRTAVKQTGQEFSQATTLKSRKAKTIRGQKFYGAGGVSIQVFKQGKRKTLPMAFAIGVRKSDASGKTIPLSGRLIFARGKKAKTGFSYSKDRMPIDAFSNISIATAALNAKSKKHYSVAVNQYAAKRFKYHTERMIKKIEGL